MSIKEKLMWAVSSLIIIVVGVYLGIFLSVKTGISANLSSSIQIESEINNQTDFHIGDMFPDHLYEDSLKIYDLLDQKNSIVAFVENGCEPCLQFLEYIQENENRLKEDYKIILLSADPTFLEQYGLKGFKVDFAVREKLKINATPTIMGVGQDHSIKFIACGYGSMINKVYMDKLFS